MIFIIIFSIVFFFVVIALFSFPQLSPIPYFPSQPVDLPKIIIALNLKKNQTVFDLGAGDGVVIFEAAKESFKRNLNTQFIAVEINPILLCIVYIRRLLHPNKKNIRIVYGDIFKMNFSSYTLRPTPYSLTFYLYISPWYLEKTIQNIKSQFKHFSVVSYMYPIKRIESQATIIEGKNKIFIYQVF